MSSSSAPWWVYASVLIAAVVSLASLSYRYRVEQGNKAVMIAAEIDQIQRLSAAQGLDFELGLKRMREAGMIGVAVSEDTIQTKVDEGAVTVVRAPVQGPDGRVFEGPVLEGSSEELSWIRKFVEARFPMPAENEFYEIAPGVARLGFRGSSLAFADIADTSIGIDIARSGDLVLEGLVVIGRFVNPAGTNADTIRLLIERLLPPGNSVFLPMGDQVLGRRENIETLVEALRANNVLYASPEFAKLGGDANVVEKAPEITVRLHSAQAAELDKMTESAAVERYSKAAAERGMRILLLRPLSLSSPKPLDDFAHFVGAVRNQIQREGLAARKARPFVEPGPPKWLFPAIGLAAAPAVFYVVTTFLGSGLWLGFFGVICLALGAGAYVDAVRPFTALACAIAFPTLAFIWLDGRRGSNLLVSYALMTLVSLSGGLCVAGLLNSLPYMLHSDQFFGVKLAHYLPVALVGGYFLSRLTDFRGSLRSQVTWSQAALFVVVMAALALMFMRTGNDNPEAVSGLEIKIRSLLESVLVVRPRTKEILFGHPALVIGLGMLAIQARMGEKLRRLSGWTVLALTMGAIGQTSVVNTMCHIHTPILVSLERIGVGAVVGGIIGALVWAVLKGRLSKAEAHS